MFKLFVVTFTNGIVVDTKVIEYDSMGNADKAAALLNAASGKSAFNVVITKLY